MRLLLPIFVTCCASVPQVADDGGGSESTGSDGKRKTGWKALLRKDTRGYEDAVALAESYRAFLDRSKTPREASRELASLADRLGLDVIPTDPKVTVIVHPGQRSIDEGVLVVVASLDAPRLELKSSPLRERDGLGLLELHIYGGMHRRSWLSVPLALHGAYARGGQTREIVIGEKEEDPILIVPDLLPHLSGKIQSKRVADPERLDALGARTSAAFLSGLESATGLTAAGISSAELYLVPAGSAQFVGVDRGLVGGYAQFGKALAFAAVHALAKAKPTRPVVILGIDRSHQRWAGATGLSAVRRAVTEFIAKQSGDSSALRARQVLSRTHVLVAGDLGGTLGRGVVLNNRQDDANPEIVRRVVDAFDGAGAQLQFSKADYSGPSPARMISDLNVDVLEISIPTAGRSTPTEVISILDLHMAKRGLKGLYEAGAN